MMPRKAHLGSDASQLGTSSLSHGGDKPSAAEYNYYPLPSLPTFIYVSLILSHSTAMFSQIPSEIILLIAGHINTERDLYSLVQVNRRFYRILNISLYKLNNKRRHDHAYSRSFAILWAAEYGQEGTLRHALAAGAHNTRDRLGQTPLIVAACFKQHAIVETLLHLPDVNPNEQDMSGRTALTWAAENGDIKLLQRLLQHPLIQPDLNTCESNTRATIHCDTPLIHAARNGHALIVKTLLETGKVNPNARGPYSGSPHWPTAITEAASKGHEAAFRELLAAPNIHFNGNTLYAAVLGRNKQIVSLLLDRNAHNGHYDDLKRPLHIAIRMQDVEIVRLLIDKGVDLNSRNEFGYTPLTLANRLENDSIAKLLKASGNCYDPTLQVNPLISAGGGSQPVLRTNRAAGSVVTTPQVR